MHPRVLPVNSPLPKFSFCPVLPKVYNRPNSFGPLRGLKSLQAVAGLRSSVALHRTLLVLGRNRGFDPKEGTMKFKFAAFSLAVTVLSASLVFADKTPM